MHGDWTHKEVLYGLDNIVSFNLWFLFILQLLAQCCRFEEIGSGKKAQAAVVIVCVLHTISDNSRDLNKLSICSLFTCFVY